MARAAVSACGPSWSIVPAPAVAGSDLLDVTTAPGGTMWAVGASGPGGTLQALIKEMTAGGWVSVPAATPDDSVLESVAAVAADDIWAVGNYSVSGKAVPLVEHWMVPPGHR
jgi:hypothetical protein